MITLEGIQVESFCHPKEQAVLDSINNTAWLQKLLNWVEQKETQLTLYTNALGRCFAVTKADVPELCRLLDEVCETLDYSGEIRLFTFRSPSFDMEVYAGQPAMLLVPDFILNEFDQEMIRFKLGRAVTALKAQTAQLTLAVEALSILAGSLPFVGDAVMAVLSDWCRKTKYTQDRGGLLACQNKETAFRAVFRECGLPLEYIDTGVVPQYIQSYRVGEKLVDMTQYAKTIKRMKPWNNDRIVELQSWIQSGEYDDILEEYE